MEGGLSGVGWWGQLEPERGRTPTTMRVATSERIADSLRRLLVAIAVEDMGHTLSRVSLVRVSSLYPSVRSIIASICRDFHESVTALWIGSAAQTRRGLPAVRVEWPATPSCEAAILRCRDESGVYQVEASLV